MLLNVLVLLLAPLTIIAQSEAEIKYYENLIKKNVEKALKYKFPNSSQEFELKSTKTDPIDYGSYDFIIIGAGSAGAVLASRLTEISKWKVLLIEAGGEETDFTDIPGMWAFAGNSPLNWGYKTKPQKTCCLGMKNQQCIMIRGKALGGSSAINSLAYIRGNKRDYDHWAELGNAGWAYADVLPYFKKSENAQFSNREPGYHGEGGPLDVEYSLPFSGTFLNFVDANLELGKDIGDYNGKTQDVVSMMQFNIRHGKRASTGRTYLDPARVTRRNLNVTIHSLVTKVIIENKTARGVLFRKTDGNLYRAEATKEVILSGGVFNTPQLLMLSGIGPKKHLDEIGIPLVADLPQVGENLQDHTAFFGAIFKTNYTVTNNKASNQIKQFLNGVGPLTNTGNTALSYLKLDDRRPQIEIIFLSSNSTSALHGSPFNFNEAIQNWLKTIDPMTSIRFHVALLHPKSKGAVKLKSADPLAFPDIDLNWLSEDEDVDKLVRGVEHVLKMVKTESFRKIDAELIDLPVCGGEHRRGSREFWKCAVRQMSSSIFHPMSTCRMGKSGEDSVVDASGSVHGLKKLRVVDGSVIPATVSGHLNAIIVMMAEKIADEIKKSHGEK